MLFYNGFCIALNAETIPNIVQRKTYKTCPDCLPRHRDVSYYFCPTCGQRLQENISDSTYSIRTDIAKEWLTNKGFLNTYTLFFPNSTDLSPEIWLLLKPEYVIYYTVEQNWGKSKASHKYTKASEIEFFTDESDFDAFKNAIEKSSMMQLKNLNSLNIKWGIKKVVVPVNNSHDCNIDHQGNNKIYIFYQKALWEIDGIVITKINMKKTQIGDELVISSIDDGVKCNLFDIPTIIKGLLPTSG